MSEESSDQFVLAWPALQNDSTGGMTELVYRDPQPCTLVDALANLAAERDLALGASALPRKQPIFVSSAEQCGSEVVYVLVDEVREILFKRVFQLDPVLDVVVRKDEPVV
jgi:hypothetical protein